MDATELAAGLVRLGVDVGNNSMVLTMMMEAGAKLQQHAVAARMLTCTHTTSTHNELSEMPMYVSFFTCVHADDWDCPDIDGNNGIDFGEFKDVIFRVLEEE